MGQGPSAGSTPRDHDGVLQCHREQIGMFTRVLGQLPTEDNSPPDKKKALEPLSTGPRFLGLFPTRTTVRWGIVLVGSCPDTVYKSSRFLLFMLQSHLYLKPSRKTTQGNFHEIECEVVTSWQLRGLRSRVYVAFTGSTWCLLEGCRVHPVTATYIL